MGGRARLPTDQPPWVEEGGVVMKMTKKDCNAPRWMRGLVVVTAALTAAPVLLPSAVPSAQAMAGVVAQTTSTAVYVPGPKPKTAKCKATSKMFQDVTFATAWQPNRNDPSTVVEVWLCTRQPKKDLHRVGIGAVMVKGGNKASVKKVVSVAYDLRYSNLRLNGDLWQKAAWRHEAVRDGAWLGTGKLGKPIDCYPETQKKCLLEYDILVADRNGNKTVLSGFVAPILNRAVAA